MEVVVFIRVLKRYLDILLFSEQLRLLNVAGWLESPLKSDFPFLVSSQIRHEPHSSKHC